MSSYGFTPELKKLLREAGCYFVRQGKGDHEIWYSPISNRNFTVDNHIPSRHLANAVLKQAGIPKAF
ncbi:MAG: type II toxin-antitoxin system HicA family toxin [Deltaproteobacteria bacterium]|nr:type II toxin-antitoxin system HicA family toxin [Deltaproteobacteria bacterium]